MNDLVEEFVVEHRGQKATVRLEQESEFLWAFTVLLRPEIGLDPPRQIPVGYLETRSDGFQEFEVVRAAATHEAKAQIDSILDRE